MAWDPKTDGSCKAFGAAAVMRMPTRVRISWADDVTLKIETDNGQQTRLLHFGAGPPPGAPSLQGDSAADWQRTLPPQTIRSGSTSEAGRPRRPAARCASSRPI
jgi:hypothetical protein